MEVGRLMDSIKTGNATIDGEHLALFECLEEITTHLGDKEGEKAFAACQKLGEMLEDHFKSEEEILHKSDFPRMENHLATHNETRELFKKACTECGQVCRKNGPTECLEDLTFILVDHFLRGDLDFKSHLQAVNMSNDNG
jgi:hemerythrin-like metal-binding protein